MEVRQLQIFRILAEELNFTRTAEKVNTVQSNVTAQIKALEEELGTPLFDRLGRRVVLTDAGHRFLPFAEQALEAMEQGQRALRNGSDPTGPLRISAPESLLTYRLPPVVNAFRRRYPHVELRFRPHLDDTQLCELETGKLDVVINMCDSPYNPTHTCIPLNDEKIVICAHPNHPLVKLRAVKPADLAGQTFFLTESGCGYRAKFDKMLALANIRPGSITEFSSVEAIKQCVIAGMGLAVLPMIVVEQEVRDKKIKTLNWSGAAFDITTHVRWHKDKWLSPALAAFLELVKSQSDDRPMAVNE
jgi:DNA-binding transcriptional LysR family regulator